MTPQQAKDSLRRLLTAHGEDVTIKRYTGSELEGSSASITVRARVTDSSKEELVDGRQQGDVNLVVHADDVTGIVTLPLVPDDKVIVRSREMNIEVVDDNTRRIDGVLIGLNLVARG